MYNYVAVQCSYSCRCLWFVSACVEHAFTEGPGPSTKHPRLEENEDAISLLDDSEALQLIEFDPQVKPTDSWDPPAAIRTFLEKHFNKVLSEEERDAIMKDFPKPNIAAVVTPRLTGDAAEQLEEQGKESSLWCREGPVQHTETAARCHWYSHMPVGGPAEQGG